MSQKNPSSEIEIPSFENTTVEMRKSLVVPNVTKALLGKPPVVKSAEDKQKRFDELQLIKGEIKRLDADRKSFTDPIRNLFDRIKARYDETINPLKEAENLYKKAILDWDDAEEKRIAEENRKAREEAERKAKAEEDRKRKEKEEQERQWREKEEKARKEREEAERKAREAKSEQERKEAEERAKKLKQEEEKAAAKAEERAQQAQEISVAPEVAPIQQAQKTSGQSYRKKWSGLVTDPTLVPRAYLMIDQKKIDASIQAMDGEIQIAGVKNQFEKIMSAGSK